MQLKIRFLAIALACLPILPAAADWTKLKADEFSMQDPPAEGSAAYRADFRELHEWEEKRSEADCALANRQRYADFTAFYGHSPELLSREEFLAVKSLLERVSKVTERISGQFKDVYLRPRPFNVDTTLEPCAHKPSGSKAYPSSHAAVAAADACVLGKLFPSRVRDFRERGAYLGELRARVGVHHPSDVAAGQKLAADICERLMDEKDFREELDETKDQLP